MMYKRQPGDDLCKDDPRLKYKWDWSRIASCYSLSQLKNWTHFQVSECKVGHWTLHTVQWTGNDDHIYYTAEIKYIGDSITRDGRDEENIVTRIDAQIKAEELLIEWITGEYEQICKR